MRLDALMFKPHILYHPSLCVVLRREGRFVIRFVLHFATLRFNFLQRFVLRIIVRDKVPRERFSGYQYIKIKAINI